MTRDPHLRLALVALGSAAFLICLMPATQLWDWDEPLYARTAIEMLGHGNWILPTFNGAVFPDKPPLTYWLMALSVSAFGQTDFAVRLPSGIEMALAVWMTGRIGMRLFSARVGWLAALVLATSLLPVYIGAAAMVDAGLLAAICFGFLALLPILKGEARGRDFAVFGVALLLAMLAKGPVGPAVLCTGVAVGFALLPGGARPPMRQFWALVGVSVLAFLGFLLWAVPANIESGGEMLQKGVGLHVIGRAFGAMQGHGGKGFWGWLKDLPYYVPVIVLGLFPWTLLLPAGLSRLWRGRIGDRTARAFLWAWILPGFVLFSLAATKLPHYVLPIFPALAIAMAAAAEGLRRPWVGLTLQGLAGLAVAAVPVVGAARLPIFAPPDIFIPVAVLLFLPFVAGLWALLRNRPLPVLPLATLAVVGFAGLYWLVLPAAEPGIKLSRPLGAAIERLATPRTRIFMGGYTEPSLVFYAHLPADRVIAPLPTSKPALKALLAGPAPLLIVATKPLKARLDALSGGHPLSVVLERTAVNTNAGGRSQTVYLLARPVGAGG